jgi:hypothetical protein
MFQTAHTFCDRITLWNPHSKLGHIMLSLLCQYTLTSIKQFLFSYNLQAYFQYPLYSPYLLWFAGSTHNHYFGQVSKYWFSLCHINRRQSWWLSYNLHLLIWNENIYLWLSYFFLCVYFNRCFVHVGLQTVSLVHRMLFSGYRTMLRTCIISVTYRRQLFGGGCVDACDVNVNSRWKCVVSFVLHPLYPRLHFPLLIE